MTWTVELTDEEINQAKNLGEGRQGIADEVGSKSKRLYKNRSEEHIVGSLGEIAYARIFGLPCPKLGCGGDHGIDFNHNGVNVDVKTSRRGSNLLVKEIDLKRSQADLYVQAFLTPPRKIHFAGWATKQKMEKMPVSLFRGIPCHHARVTDLMDMNVLMEGL